MRNFPQCTVTTCSHPSTLTHLKCITILSLNIHHTGEPFEIFLRTHAFLWYSSWSIVRNQLCLLSSNYSCVRTPFFSFLQGQGHLSGPTILSLKVFISPYELWEHIGMGLVIISVTSFNLKQRYVFLSSTSLITDR